MVPSNKPRIYRVVPTTEQKRAWTERRVERQRRLLELPLILVPQHLLQEPEESWQHSPDVIAALNKWMTKATLDDLQLSFERPWIPKAEIYIPNTPKGKNFFKLANVIGKIIPSVNIIPKNQNQAYWLKTLQYYWQARGVLLAYKLFGVIPNPIEEQGVLWRYLPKKLLLDLDLLTNLDYFQIKLLRREEQYIREWAAKEKIPYPFNNLLELFVESKKQSFLMLWQIGPMNSEPNWLPKAQQKSNISKLIRLLGKKPGLPENPLRPSDEQMKQDHQDYLEYLKNADWGDKWLLPLLERFDEEQFTEKQLSRNFQHYINALKAGKELYVLEFEWRGGQPYKTRATNKVERIEGFIDPLGYILWRWA